MKPNGRILKGVLAGFLGTYTSRYSDHQGFWLFGFIVEAHCPIEIDLLTGVEDTTSLEGITGDLARIKFRKQLRKHGFDVSVVLHALLTIEHGPHMVTRMAGDFVREGFDTVFRVSIVTDTKRRFEGKEVQFVAPHDERFERRSGRWR
jgi:hypothetical protein